MFVTIWPKTDVARFRYALLRRFAAFAESDDFRRVHSVVVDLHFDHFAALIDQVVYPARCLVFWIIESVLAGDVAAPIAQQRESNSDFFGPRLITEGAVHTYTQYLGVRSFQLLQVLLEVLHLFRSTTGKSENVESQGHVLFATEIVERNLVPFGV